jgi:hypothetical protein
MEDNGTLDLLWEQHIVYQSTLEKSCTDKSNIGVISRRRLSNNSNGRRLKNSIDTVDRAEQRRLTSDSTSTIENDTNSERLSLREMAGTFLGENGISSNRISISVFSFLPTTSNLRMFIPSFIFFPSSFSWTDS